MRGGLTASAVVLFSLVLFAFMLVVGALVFLVFGRLVLCLRVRFLCMGRCLMPLRSSLLFVLLRTFFTGRGGSGMRLHLRMKVFLLHRLGLSFLGLLAGLLRGILLGLFTFVRCLLFLLRALLLLLLLQLALLLLLALCLLWCFLMRARTRCLHGFLLRLRLCMQVGQCHLLLSFLRAQ